MELTPKNREEALLNGDDLEPKNRLEYFLKKAGSGGSGGGIVPTPEAEDDGKVLTASNDGTASWQTPSGGASGGNPKIIIDEEETEYILDDGQTFDTMNGKAVDIYSKESESSPPMYLGTTVFYKKKYILGGNKSCVVLSGFDPIVTSAAAATVGFSVTVYAFNSSTGKYTANYYVTDSADRISLSS